MSVYTLQNDQLKLQMDDLGAELTSVLDQKTNKEYLWNADPAYWKRHSPILFPIVGSVKNKTYTYQGKEYTLPQHGFARDAQFICISQSENEIWFRLEATEETLKVYPFLFALEIGYQLIDRSVKCLWKVMNQDTSVMYFSIGGHPAFYCPLDPSHNQNEYYFGFDQKDPLHYILVDNQGFAVNKPFEEQYILDTDQGVCPIDPHMFDHDALIIEHHQCHEVSLLDPSKKPYVTVTFDAPLFGLWSPTGKNAPFICIEPWYGRCDNSDFFGSLEEKAWINSLAAGDIFSTFYTITIA
ncbi:MAG: Aldose 1-epimerase [Herbinix sp.]|jgi:galactose mutarotase-like enzyme|nr:Aldose 1-epimerase [Herbinix sp.]